MNRCMCLTLNSTQRWKEGDENEYEFESNNCTRSRLVQCKISGRSQFIHSSTMEGMRGRKYTLNCNDFDKVVMESTKKQLKIIKKFPHKYHIKLLDFGETRSGLEFITGSDIIVHPI